MRLDSIKALPHKGPRQTVYGVATLVSSDTKIHVHLSAPTMNAILCLILEEKQQHV